MSPPTSLDGFKSSPRSSLSLNVLFKNFGANNLTDLDQILLRSTLRDEALHAASRSRESSVEEGGGNQRIEITGLQVQNEPSNKLVGVTAEEDDQVAECKIEYTVKHVNISLTNGGRSDYTCDYIIDRKLTSSAGSKPTKFERTKVCKLRLMSKFFSNKSEPADGAQPARCNGTYLIVGSLRFCYVKQSATSGQQYSSLDRVFDFPVSRDAFDIKMVHKQRSKRDPEIASAEIHLEIKPLIDEDCERVAIERSSVGWHDRSAVVYVEKGAASEPEETSRASVAPTKPQANKNGPLASSLEASSSAQPKPVKFEQVRPALGESMAEGRASSLRGPQAVRVVASDQRRRFVVKIPHEKQLHPLNNRFRVSQSFDITSAPNFYSIESQQQEAASKANDDHSDQRKPPMELCDNFEHISTLGQLTSANYPNYYLANTTCTFLIKRASLAYCQLLLHFRDFDLISDESDSSGAACLGDYLLIGETRYCNKYAMIGHKMKLDFPARFGEDPYLNITFHSDHLRSGRGFLIKYQQLACNLGDSSRAGQGDGERPKEITSTTMIGDLLFAPKQHTVAPPMQQPDFSFASQATPASSVKRAKSLAESGVRVKPVVQANEIQPRPNFKERPVKLASDAVANTGKSGAGGGLANSTGTLLPMASTVSSSTSSLGSQAAATKFDLFSSTTSSLQWTQPGGTDCNQVNNERSFFLRSQNYPDNYGHNLHCIHYVRKNSSQICYLELTFIKFDLEADSDCRFDYLEINNVRLCGSLKDLAHKTTRIYLFEEPIKEIRFRSDSSGSRGGFFIRAEQLECASGGSILRKEKSFDQTRGATTMRELGDQGASQADGSSQPSGEKQEARVGASTEAGNASKLFEYDSVLSQPAWWGPRQRAGSGSGSSLAQPAPAGASGRQGDERASFACDDFFYGKEVTIKSPLWPESYLNDESISRCRYTIVRSTIGRNKICQLELRFVNLRLGTSDCIDVDGYEVLCGFNTRNMIKYYPFERQSHLTVTFFTASAKMGKSARNHSDLLPTRMPLRFMIVAKQHECIDGFLSPHEELVSYNQTNLLYSPPRYANRSSALEISAPGAELPATRPATRGPVEQAEPDSPSEKRTELLLKYDFSSSMATANKSLQRAAEPTLMYSLASITLDPVNREPPKQKQQQQQQRAQSLQEVAHPSGCPDGSLVIRGDKLFTLNYPLKYENNSHCVLRIGKSSPSTCQLELEFLDLDLESSQVGGECGADYLQFNFGQRLCNMDQVETIFGPKRQLVFPFGRLHGDSLTVVFHSDQLGSRRGLLLRHRQLDCAEAANLANKHSLSQPNGTSSQPAHRPQATVQSSNSGQLTTSANTDLGQRCLLQLGQFNGILSSSSVISRLRADYPLKNECEVRIRLLPGYCRVELNFGDFDLMPRIGNYCLEFLQLDGVQYCGSELRNQNRVLSMTEASERVVSIKYSGSNSSNIYTFRAIFKQLECQPEPLKPVGQAELARQVSALRDSRNSSAELAAKEGEQQSQSQSQVNFREIVLRGEFFELNSAKLAATSGKSYQPNMFVVYRIKRANKEVCKLRLMFYRFNLEASPGCKSDFLDVNNVDRLCGQLAKAEDSRRDYEWPAGERDFLISFVSDSSLQRDGFLLFGQQIHSNCSVAAATAAKQPAESGTFDEEAPKEVERQSEVAANSSRAGPAEEAAAGQDCFKLFYEQNFELASPAWPQRYPPRATCYYLIHKSKPDICSVTFNVLSLVLGKGEPLDGEDEQNKCDPNREDSLEIDGQLLCGLIRRPRPISVHFGQRQFVSVKFRSHLAEGFGFLVEGRQGRCSGSGFESESESESGSGSERRAGFGGNSSTEGAAPELAGRAPAEATQGGCNLLLTGELSQLESGHFPQQYAHNQDCLYAFRRTNRSVCAIDIQMNHFHLEEASSASGNCEHDYLEVDYSRFCGFYPPKHRLRFNYFGDELDKYVRFRTDAANARSGFSLTVSQVRECQPQPAKRVEAERERKREEVIGYLPSSAAPAAANLSSKSQFELEERGTASSVGALEPNTLCQFVYQRERQFLHSPAYNEQKLTYDNNVDCLYKIIAKSYDFCSLKLTIMDLNIERSSGCQKDYLLIDNQRYCGLGDQEPRSVEVQFADSLPREIHLLYHTDSSVNFGRGFKLQYEQLACNQLDADQNFGLQNGDMRLTHPAASGAAQRQARQMRFGQLSYPRGHVSSGAERAAHRQPAQGQRVRSADGADGADGGALAAANGGPNQPSGDLEEQHDDLTLRRQIVVANSGQQARVRPKLTS